MSNTIPTPIVDKNGKNTTVHKKVDDSSAGVARVAGIVSSETPANVNPATGQSYPAGLTHGDVESITNWFLITAVFTATHTEDEDEGEPEPIDGLGYDYNDFNEASQEKAFNLVVKFATDNEDIVKEALARPGYDADDFGGDLNYTINGHGTGFWDREPLKEGGLGEKLTAASTNLPDINVYVGSNGELDLD